MNGLRTQRVDAPKQISPESASCSLPSLNLKGFFEVRMCQDFIKGLGHHLTDMNRTEILALAPLFGLTILFGLFPAVLLDVIQTPVGELLASLGGATVTGVLP